jgi:tryptophanyl-tRNA synthetase
MEIIVSGIRPTGLIHLGNYFGAIQNFIKLQHEHRCYFFIADYHSHIQKQMIYIIMLKKY